MHSTEQELVALYQEWMAALKEKDMQTLERIIGAEFTYTASGHGRYSRHEWMDSMGDYDINTFAFPSIEVRQYGEVAIALLRYRQEGMYRGERRSGDFLITDMWVLREGRWQVVARSSILTEQ